MADDTRGARRYAIGDRVEIVNRDHPWVGRRGHIVEPFKAAGLDWSVELEGQDGNYFGQRVAVGEGEIRRRPRGI